MTTEELIQMARALSYLLEQGEPVERDRFRNWPLYMGNTRTYSTQSEPPIGPYVSASAELLGDKKNSKPPWGNPFIGTMAPPRR